MTTITIIVILLIALHFFLKAAKKHADKVDRQVRNIFKQQKNHGEI
jgi:hypothetical protein